MKHRTTTRSWMVVGAFAALIAMACADVPRLVVEDRATGFALYRSGRLSATALGRLCAVGVEEILVLDGDGESRECTWRDSVCPGLRVRYNRQQDPDQPLSVDFLHAFDTWIELARTNGRMVAFRCRHGWHRAGRLAAYYRLRFENASLDEVLREMNDFGHWMWLHPSLRDQVTAYADLIAGRTCSTAPETCPVEVSDPALDATRFAEDVCLGPRRDAD